MRMEKLVQFSIFLVNKPGVLSQIFRELAKAKINVKYVYATAYTKAQKTAAVVAVEEKDLDKRRRSCVELYSV